MSNFARFFPGFVKSAQLRVIFFRWRKWHFRWTSNSAKFREITIFVSLSCKLFGTKCRWEHFTENGICVTQQRLCNKNMKVKKMKWFFVILWIILVFLWKESYKIKARFGVYAFQDSPLCSSTHHHRKINKVFFSVLHTWPTTGSSVLTTHAGFRLSQVAFTTGVTFDPYNQNVENVITWKNIGIPQANMAMK